MICLFGGTFDPVHVGHVHAAAAVCDALALAEIRMLLSARPGHRGRTGAGVSHRWNMLALACAGDRRLVPDDTEVGRAERAARPSYAVETLEQVRGRHPDAVVAWVVGSDAYAELATWHRWEDLLTLGNLIVLRRPGAPLDLPAEIAALTRARQVVGRLTASAGGVLLLEAPMLDVSASRIRQMLSEGDRAVADLLPPAVYTYITKYHLYGVVSDA